MVKGVVLDAETGETLAFANVVSGKQSGTITNAEGQFYINVSDTIQALTISYIGYQKAVIPLQKGKEYYKISLQPAVESLGTVVISGKYVDPAIALMRRFLAKKSENDYRKRLKKYSFEKYYKFLVTADPDSIDASLDSVFVKGKFTKIDSSLYDFKKELADKDLFIMESVMKVNATSGVEKNKVIASRTAGLKNPMYELLALQVSNFNVYDDRYKFFIKDYLGPLTKLSLKQYKYEIIDTIAIQDRKVYELSYLNTQKPLISGKIYIDKESLAIAKMTLNTFKQFELQTTYNFKYYPSYHTWFPKNSSMLMRKAKKKDTLTVDGVISVIENDKEDEVHSNKNNELDYLYALAQTHYLDVHINRLHQDKIRYNLQIATDANKKNSDFWSHYRDTIRVKRELNTYHYIDSIAKEEGVERKLNQFRKIGHGSIPLGALDMDIVNLFDKNEYEGFRVSLGAKTNEKLSDKFFVSAYAAYGFKDKDLKYHGQLNYKINHFSQTFIHLGYTHDLQPSTSFEDYQNGFFLGGLSHMSYDKFYMKTALNVGISHLITSALAARLDFTRQSVKAQYPLPLNTAAVEIPELHGSHIQLHLDYRPFSKFFLSPYGREEIKQAYPQFYFNIAHIIPDPGADMGSFTRLDFQTYFKKVYLRKAYTEAIVKLGYATQGSPLLYLYSPKTNGYDDSGMNWYEKIHWSTNSGFETMRQLEFAGNFVSTLHISHSFPKVQLSKKYYFELRFIGRAAWGFAENSNRYLGVKTLDKPYFETGVECNRLIKFLGTGFGAGFYYRIGTHAYADPMDNLAIKLTLSPFSLF